MDGKWKGLMEVTCGFYIYHQNIRSVILFSCGEYIHCNTYDVYNGHQKSCAHLIIQINSLNRTLTVYNKSK